MTVTLRRFVARYLYGLQAVLLPNVCTVCGRHLLPSEKCVCRLCLDELPATAFEGLRGNPVEERMFGRVRLRGAFSCFYYRKNQAIRHIIHEFKYHHNKEIAREMGREMGRRALRSGFLEGYDCIVPVPLHPRKIKTRGYNQSELLADGLSQVSGLPVFPNALTRSIFAGTQTHLDPFQRFVNVRADFTLGPDAPNLAGKTVLLIDDVFTTGATSEACLEPLLTIDGISVGLATLAFAAG